MQDYLLERERTRGRVATTLEQQILAHEQVVTQYDPNDVCPYDHSSARRVQTSSSSSDSASTDGNPEPESNVKLMAGKRNRRKKKKKTHEVDQTPMPPLPSDSHFLSGAMPTVY